MKRRACDLAAHFGASLSLAACAGATEPVDGTPVGVGSSAPDVPTTSATASATVAPSSSTVRRPPPPPHDDTTAEGYAAAFQSIQPYAVALSGLELLGFGDVVDGKLVWEGQDCPAEWNVVVDGSFSRAAIVKKSRTLTVITAANFSQWVGPVDTPEKAALRAQLEDGRALATCGRVRIEGFACAAGSDDHAVAVRETDDGAFEVATYDSRPVCGSGSWGTAIALGASRVEREGDTTEARNILTAKTYGTARTQTECHYPVRGRAFEGFVDDPPEACEAAYYARATKHEAAAAVAFDRLASELEAHGAPAALVADAREAAGDERRHASIFAAYVDGALDAPVAGPFPARPLVDVLLENAREGCANESYAAVIATYQATHAPTARLRAAISAIAGDERRHAELAHRIHAWGLGAVGADRERLAHAFSDAVEAIARGGSATETALQLGEPPPELARAAFRTVVTALQRV